MTDSRPKVLMLDDERLLLDLYKMKFDKMGYEVRTCYDADEALRVLREGYDPAVVLFDITMPDSKSGYEFIETVKRERLANGALKVALTNEGSEGAIGRAEELGADAHFLKAKYIPSELVSAITEMLHKKA